MGEHNTQMAEEAGVNNTKPAQGQKNISFIVIHYFILCKHCTECREMGLKLKSNLIDRSGGLGRIRAADQPILGV